MARAAGDKLLSRYSAIAGRNLNRSSGTGCESKDGRPQTACPGAADTHQALALSLPETAVQWIFEPDPAPGSVNGTRVSGGKVEPL